MRSSRIRWILPALVVVAVAAATGAASTRAGTRADAATAPRTPIEHVVVIFQENVSFDHYFGTYPHAANTDGRKFVAGPDTPAVDGLKPATDPSIPVGLQHAADLTATNPNSSLPIRLTSDVDGPGGNGNGIETCDQDHNYSDEQQAFDSGLMDQFVQSVGTDGGTKIPRGTVLCDPKTVMDYYDGNVLTGLWNYADHYSMSDNSYGTTFGPSAPGAINLVSGDTGNVDMAHTDAPVTISSSTAPNADVTPDGTGGYSLTSDAQPYWDDCSTRDAVALSGKNIGDELNAAGLSWGWFEGGFRPTETFAAATGGTQATSSFIPDEFKNSGFQANVPHSTNQGLCDAVHPIAPSFGATLATAPWGYKDDYIPHHEPFEYYASTANPHHLTIPTDGSGNDTLAGLATIGTDTQSYSGTTPQFNTPNHNYDTSDFDQLVSAITAGQLPASALPAVSFIKAPGYQDGHAQYSNPIDEQAFVVKTINELEKTPDWGSTAVLVNYDDSDGWYDHAYSGVVNPSNAGAENLTNTVTGAISAAHPTSGKCGSEATATPLAGEQGRCGFGPRLPMLLVSPWARTNHVDHNLSDQASVPNFIEYNWGLPGITGSFDQALRTQDRANGLPFDLAGLFHFGPRTGHPGLDGLPLDPATGQIDLRSANLAGQDLHANNFAGAEAGSAKLAGANLQGSFLANADLRGANLAGTNLEGADLTGANLAGATLTGAKTARVTWSNTTCPDGTNSTADGGTCKGHF